MTPIKIKRVIDGGCGNKISLHVIKATWWLMYFILCVVSTCMNSFIYFF